MSYYGFGSMAAMMKAMWGCPLLRYVRLADMEGTSQQGMDRMRDAFLAKKPKCKSCREPLWHFTRVGLCDRCRRRINSQRFNARHPHYNRDWKRKNGQRRKAPECRTLYPGDESHAALKQRRVTTNWTI